MKRQIARSWPVTFDNLGDNVVIGVDWTRDSVHRNSHSNTPPPRIYETIPTYCIRDLWFFWAFSYDPKIICSRLDAKSGKFQK